MRKITPREARSHLSPLVAQIASGRESEIAIAENGVAAARRVPLPTDGTRFLKCPRGTFQSLAFATWQT